MQMDGFACFMTSHQPVIIQELHGELSLHDVEKWVVIHCKPRTEKKLACYLRTLDMTHYLPTGNSEHLYKYRKVTFQKPLFPGYLFVRLKEQDKQKIVVTGHTVGFIKVPEQEELVRELKAIYLSGQTEHKAEPAIWLESGIAVEIVSGPLKGVQGIVESQSDPLYVNLQVSILHSAVRIKVKSGDLMIPGANKQEY